MFEIGSALRTARERQGLERADVERKTHVRERYLAALEDERFDVIPARAYAKGFLRVYADFLGLDGQRFVDEFNSRYPEPEQPEPVSPAPPAPLRSRGPSLITLGGAALVAVAMLGVLAWRLTSTHNTRPPPTVKQVPARRHGSAPASVAHRSHKTPAATAHLVLRARGPCWLNVRVGSATGAVLYEGTLGSGAALRYTLASTRPRIWVRMGAPWNLQVAVNGKPAGPLPTGPGNIIVTRRGLA